MSAAFASPYADSYDAFYAEKDYETECDYIEEAIRRHCDAATRRILDVGCGTGGHALVLAGRGYAMTGIDLSTSMLEIARGKGGSAGVSVDWQAGDIRTFHCEGPFDVAVAMFAVVGYLTELPDLVAAMTNVRQHVRTGGLFLFDVWYGPAVLTMRPMHRSRVLESGRRTVIRVSQPTLRADRDVVDVRMRLWALSDGVVETQSDETHVVRYFFLPELTALLAGTGFELLASNAFPDIDGAVNEGTWNLGCIARAR